VGCPFVSPNFSSPNNVFFFISPNFNSPNPKLLRVRVRARVVVRVSVTVRSIGVGYRRFEIRRNGKEPSVDCS